MALLSGESSRLIIIPRSPLVPSGIGCPDPRSPVRSGMLKSTLVFCDRAATPDRELTMGFCWVSTPS